MPAILQSLIENHWLKSKSEMNQTGAIKVEYSFTHPLMHKTLYDLTPSSVKISIHLSIAQVIILFLPSEYNPLILCFCFFSLTSSVF